MNIRVEVRKQVREMALCEFKGITGYTALSMAPLYLSAICACDTDEQRSEIVAAARYACERSGASYDEVTTDVEMILAQPEASEPEAADDPLAHLSDEALSAVQDIDDLCGRLAMLPERADDFADGAGDILRNIREWIVENDHATERQLSAIENIDGGVSRWEDRE